ncbi:unnamed protein product [Paramecium pentaurelia]|uniref:HMG box domain-containing protein n=1 Tax=Paramecium pentaurelia TaxID=43138 RepID=A0A8S1SAT8_9CILI|nr:unnamed protein product [Paramecium pentaurelia]
MQDKKEQSKFENFLIRFKALIESYQTITPEPEEQPKQQVTKQKKQKRQKDPLAPKMPKSAFIFYFQDKREKFQQQYPNLQFQEITKLIANEWKDLPKEIQQSYHDKAFNDRSRYSQESQLYCTQTGKKFNGKSLTKTNKQSAKNEKIQQKVDQDEENDSFGADIGQE